MIHKITSPLVQKLIRQGRVKPEDLDPRRIVPRKQRNQPCEIDGQKFHSKLEYGLYMSLCAGYGARNMIRQVSFPIGKNRIRPDFLIILERFKDGSFHAKLMDAKAWDKKKLEYRCTEAWKARANHLFDKHGLKIEIQ